MNDMSKTDEKKAPSLGWTFNSTEEKSMKRAIGKSKQFMQSYGMGCSPGMVDLRYYENGCEKLPDKDLH